MSTTTLNETIDRFMKLARRIKREVRKPVTGIESGFHPGSMALFQNLILTEKLADQYAVLLVDMYEAVSGREHLSRRALASLLGKAVAAAVDVENKSALSFEKRLTQEAGRLKAELLAQPSEWEHYFRVLGFDPEGLPVQIGKVIFHAAGEEQLGRLIQRLASAIDKTSGTEQHKEAAKNTMSQDIRQRFAHEVLAAVSTRAVDSEAANELAIREVRHSLDVVNFYASSEYPPNSKVSLPWDSRGSREVFLEFRKGNRPTAVLKSEQRGTFVPVPLRRIQKMPGFSRICGLLAKSERNGFEDRLLSAFHWAGRASIAERKDEAFLFFVIALENLLLGSKKDSEIGYRFWVRGAHLLGLGLKGRRIVLRELRDSYNQRSKIVHSGSGHITDSDMYSIQHLAKNAILYVLTDPQFASMRSEKELEAWFDDRILR